MTDIRPLEPELDAESVVRIVGQSRPYRLITAESWLHERLHVPARAVQRDWAALDDGELVGYASCGRQWFSRGSESAWAEVAVAPERRRRGVGSSLYALAQEHASALGARRLSCRYVEGDAGEAFSLARGFEPARVSVRSVLDPRATDLSPLDRLPPAVRLSPWSDLRNRLDELFALEMTATLDEPRSEPVDDVRLEEWLDDVNGPLFSWDGSFAVLDDGEIVAAAELYAASESGRAVNGFTCTTGARRGRGLATAAKLASIRWARAAGVTAIWTENDDENAPMLAINRRLGYRPALREVEAFRALE